MKNIKKIISVVMACLILAGVFATSSFAAGYIGKDKAKEIALNHAGVTADKVSFMKCEFDRDDGIAVYDVEFYFDRCEYNYEINAKNGKILKVEKDRDFDFSDVFFVHWFDAIVSFIKNLFK